MTTMFKRFQTAVLAVVGPRLDYSALYTARVVAHAGGPTIQVQPDDPRIRGLGMGSLPIRYGLAGVTSVVAPGSTCLVGFASQDPRYPFVSLWSEGSQALVQTISAATSVALAAPVVTIGDGSEFVALANLVKSELETIRSQFNVHTHASSGSPPVPQIVAIGDVKSSNLRAD